MSRPEDPQPYGATHGVTPGSIVRCRNRDPENLPYEFPKRSLCGPKGAARFDA
jgi:hypothetical protein